MSWDNWFHIWTGHGINLSTWNPFGFPGLACQLWFWWIVVLFGLTGFILLWPGVLSMLIWRGPLKEFTRMKSSLSTTALAIFTFAVGWVTATYGGPFVVVAATILVMLGLAMILNPHRQMQINQPVENIGKPLEKGALTWVK